MAAIVAHVLGEAWTQPAIAEITVSETEDIVYVRKVGSTGFDGLQSLTDLRNNWNRLLDAAGLTPDERRAAVRLFHERVAKVTGSAVWGLRCDDERASGIPACTEPRPRVQLRFRQGFSDMQRLLIAGDGPECLDFNYEMSFSAQTRRARRSPFAETTIWARRSSPPTASSK